MARVQDFLANEGCDWKFIPTHAPHFEGLWEATVKSMKYHLKRTLGSQVVTYEELYTLLAEIEGCLNSKSLCTLSDDPFTQTYLSPQHFLIGEPITQLPSHDYVNVKPHSISRWQQYQQHQHFFAEVVNRLYLGFTTASALAEYNPQLATGRPGPGEG
jgi:hypothetical protein